MTKMEPSPFSDDDRRAIAKELWADRRYFAIICALFLANLAAAWGGLDASPRGLIVLAFCALPLLLLWAAFFNAFLLRNWR